LAKFDLKELNGGLLLPGDARRSATILAATATQFQYQSKAEAIILGNLALAHIGQSQADEAVTVLHKAIDVAEVTWGWQEVSAAREISDWLLTLMAAG
jgi:hypothetical protein